MTWSFVNKWEASAFELNSFFFFFFFQTFVTKPFAMIIYFFLPFLSVMNHFCGCCISDHYITRENKNFSAAEIYTVDGGGVDAEADKHTVRSVKRLVGGESTPTYKLRNLKINF